MTMLAKTETRVLGIADYEARIQLYKEQAITGYIGIGRTLNEAKAAGVVPHGEWEAWVERTTGLAIRQAQRCMKAASEIRDGSFLGQIDMSKAMLLLSSGLEDEQQEALAEKAVKEDSSVRELKEQIRKLKLEKVAEAGANAEIRTALRAAEAERDQLKDQIGAAVDAVREDAELRAQRAYEQGAKDQAEMNTAALAKVNRELDNYYEANAELLRQVEDLQERLAKNNRQEMEKEIREDVRKEYEGKISFLGSQRAGLESANEELRERLADREKEGGKRWDDGFQAGKATESERADVLEMRLKDMQRELEAAEAREAKKARELAELKKERAKAGMDAARGIRADAMNGLDLAAAVRSFIGAAGTLPQMGAAIAGMNENERDGIRAQVETVAEWVRASRAALGTVVAEASIM